MTIFSKPFFSLAGQKERLTNVGQTIKAAVTGKGVTANVNQPVLKKALEVTASHPFQTAAIATAVTSPLIRTAITSKLTTFAKAHPITVVTATGALLASPTLQKATVSHVLDPTKTGRTIGKAIEKAKEHPIISSIIGGTALAGAGLIAYDLLTKDKPQSDSTSSTFNPTASPTFNIQPYDYGAINPEMIPSITPSVPMETEISNLPSTTPRRKSISARKRKIYKQEPIRNSIKNQIVIQNKNSNVRHTSRRN